MALQIANKVAIITGGTKGIGEGIASVLSKEGVKLVLVYRSDDEYAKKLKEELDSEVMLYKLDITKHAEIERMYAEIIKHYGTIDILVNNAAGGTISKPLHELSYSEWKECEEGCLDHVFMMSKMFISHCLNNKHEGRIINVSAKAAFYSESHDKIPYATMKGAIATLSKRMANDYIADGIYVNCIVPGYVKSKYYDTCPAEVRKNKEKYLKVGWATPEEMGNIVAFLSSPKSRQIIGAVIDCSGGTML